jgi:small subunit ribosomal protein S1
LVTNVVPFGFFVRVADGVEGLVRVRELDSTPLAAPEDAIQPGDEIPVIVTHIDRERRRLTLSRRQA